MDTCSLPLKIKCWIVSPELMSLKNLMSHDSRIPGWKAVCGKDALQPSLCSPVAVLLGSNHSPAKALWGCKWSWKPPLGSRSPPSGGEDRLFAKADGGSRCCSAGTAALLVLAPSSSTRSTEGGFPEGGVTRNNFAHLINVSPLEKT